MKIETQIELVKAYLAVAEMHRLCSAEYGRHSSLRARHTAEAAVAESKGVAWARLAGTVQVVPGHTTAPEVCHA